MALIRMLGSVGVEHAEASRIGPRHRLILALLAARVGRAVDDDTLIDVIWPDGPPRSARTALQTYVSELRDLLEPDRPRRTSGRFIQTDGQAYRLHCGPGDLDLLDFETAVDAALGRIEDVGLMSVEFSTGAERVSVSGELDAALETWARPFGDVAGHERLLGVTARLLERHAVAVEVRAAIALAAGAGAEVTDALRTAVEQSPFRERLVAQLAVARYRIGDRTGALDEIRSLRTRLRDELGLDPGAEVEEIERALLDHDRTILERGESTVPDEVPRSPRRRWSVAPVFGREDEVDEVATRLAEWPVVALTGPGGIGKTTIARAVLDREPASTNTALVDLSEISAPSNESLVRAIAGALGVTEQPTGKLIEAVIDATSVEPALLVVDTAEVEPVVVDDVLVQLVRAAQLRVIVTSQIALSVQAAVDVPIGPLEPAAALRILSPLDAAGSEPLRELADALGRVPLSLEIAAARVRSHGVDETLTRLREGDDLESPTPSRPARHRSSRAAAVWGIGFLDGPSRELLERLAAHAAPADAATIRHLWSSPTLGADSIDVALGDLSRRSLLARVGRDDRVGYRVPDPVKLAILEMITPEEWAGHVRRLADAVLETAQSTLFGGNAALSLLQLEGEVPRAHDTLHEAGDMNELVLAGCCALFWAGRGRSVEGLTYMERALDSHRAAPDLLYRPVAGITTFVAYASGDMRRTRELLEVFRSGGEQNEVPTVDTITLTVDAASAFIDRDYPLAVERFDQALEFYPEPTGPRMLLTWLAGNSRWYAGRHDEARATYRSLRNDAVEIGEPHNESLAMRFEAMVDAQTGEIERAWRLAERSAALARRLGDPGSMCQAEVALAVVAHASQALADAERHALEAVRLTLRPFDLFTQRTAPPIIAAASLERDDPESAALALGWYEQYLETTDQPPTVAARSIAEDAERRAKLLLGDAGYARQRGRGAAMRLAELHRLLSEPS